MMAKGACQMWLAPGQVVLKSPASTAKDPQAARKLALENKAEILSQVRPTSKGFNIIGGKTCGMENRR
ncbi:hypothetical protein [Rhizobium binxianense]|uniref:hypothetical protein n=1 Tax=Rhizobium binxianense TaxID=3024242 RepID=UPI00235E5B0C|nr:hypothetical protein [Rhizobium sp. MJ37]MDC9833598.1 hypothetical protein [Rhizobium sp. MJ37]